MKLAALVASVSALPDSLADRIGTGWTALLILAGAFLAGMGAATLFGNLSTHEERIGVLERVVGLNTHGDTLHKRVERLEEVKAPELEAWHAEHVQEVTRPQVRRIGAVEEDISQIKRGMERLNSKVDALSDLAACQHYEITDCPGMPPPPPRPGAP